MKLYIAIRTDKPEAELRLFEDSKEVDSIKWQAHLQLAETIHKKIKELMAANQHSMNDIDGLIVYKGPGSFTGLRIGASVANTVADVLSVPIVGTSGDEWVQQGINKLLGGENDNIISPEYGENAKTTTPRK